MIKRIFILSILYSMLISSTISFDIDMNGLTVPNQDYDNIVINGSWNNWAGWGVTLSDNDGDGVYQGLLELDNGTYEYVIAATGPADNWSGWGQTINAPIASTCDWYPGDQWANYGFTVNDSDITQAYCAGSCSQNCTEDNSGLLSPPNNSFMRSVHVPFEWAQIPDAISYQLQFTNSYADNLFESELILDLVLNDIVYIDTESLEWDSGYWWRIRPLYLDNQFGEWSEVFTFTIGEKKFPERDAIIYNESILQDGLVAFGGFAGTEETNLASGVIDQYGNEIWNDGYLDFILNHINESGNIYGLSGFNWPLNTGTKISWTHDFGPNFLWSAPTPDIAVDIHEIKQIPNGNYMAFVPDYSQLGPIPQGDWTFLFQTLGYQADGITNEYPYIGMKIVEWDEEGNEIWNWNPYEHFDMQDTDLYGGMWWQALDQGIFDWMHSNAFHFDDEESVIYVSHRHLSRISKIAYPSGEVIWNMGMPAGYSTGDDNICTDLGFSYQHNVQLLEDGSLLFFDNGNLSRMLMGDNSPTTRIRRVRVINDSYCETEWEYELPPNLFGAGMGSVQLLDNDNYLIYTYGSGQGQGEPTIFEITSNHEVIWSYQGIQNAAWYRAYKIPSLHPEFFSVITDNYTQLDGENFVDISNTIDFSITNHSGYNNTYKYSFTDLSDEESYLFNNEEGEFTLGPYGTSILSFIIYQSNLFSTDIMLSVWPVNHEYAKKDLQFNVVANTYILGDINSDGILNVLDIVSLVNFVLSGDYIDSGDLNSDGLLNILDIVQLVSIILT